MLDPAARDWTLVLLLTVLSLSALVLAQALTAHVSAYLAAPGEVAVFLDTVDFSVQENESYEGDVERVPMIGDKIRLGALLRGIQRAGDDLREELGRVLVSEEGGALRIGARVLWASRRRILEDRVRRLDMLRMRFLVVYMGVVASASARNLPTTPAKGPENEKPSAARWDGSADGSPRPALAKALTESIAKRPPLRRLTTQAIGYNHDTEGSHKEGWFGVVQELQKSPKMQQRHASIETAMSTPSPVARSSVRLREMIAATDGSPEGSPTRG